MTRLIEDQQELASWAQSVQSPLDIAVAFWGNGAIKELRLNDPKRQVRILLDLASGGTNPRVVRDLLDVYPNRVRSVERLHAKTYIAETEMFVGSANASANGLGLEGTEATRWHELGLITDHRESITKAKMWFKDHWKKAQPIDVESDAFKKVEKAWKERQKHRPVQVDSQDSLIQAVIKHPEAFEGRSWYVMVDTEDMSKAAEKRIEKESKLQQRPVFGWEDFRLPKHAHLISFYYGSKFSWGKEEGAREPVYLSGDGSWRDGKVEFVLAGHIPGFKNNLGKLREWLPALKRARGKYPRWKAENGLCMDLADFIREYGMDDD